MLKREVEHNKAVKLMGGCKRGGHTPVANKHVVPSNAILPILMYYDPI